MGGIWELGRRDGLNGMWKELEHRNIYFLFVVIEKYKYYISSITISPYPNQTIARIQLFSRSDSVEIIKLRKRR